MPVLSRSIVALAAFLALLVLTSTAALAASAQQETPAAGSGVSAASIDVAHLAPFASQSISTSVEVRVNGAPAITDFVYGEVEADVALPAGTYTIEIATTDGGTVIISDTVPVMDGAEYILAAIGGANGWAPDLLALARDTAAPPSGSAKLRITHAAPFAALPADTEVDICTDAGAVVDPSLTNVPYGASSGYLTVPAGDYDLKVSDAGSNCGPAIFDLPSIRLKDGNIVDVFAIGDGTNQTPSVTTIPEVMLTPATVDVAHFAAFAADVAGTSVSIQINGEDVFTETVFGDIYTDVELPAGTYTVEVLPGGVGPAAISGSVTVTPGGDYLLAAIGNKPGTNLDLLTLVNDTQPVSGSAKVRIGHLAPFADNVADTAVDVCTDAGVPVVEDVQYPDVTDPYLMLPPGEYDLKVVPVANNCGAPALDLPPLNLVSGAIVDVFVIGLATDAFPLQAVSTTGLPIYRLYMPLIANKPLTTIAETAAAHPNLSTLVTAVTEAKLVDTLNGPGPFTVFAPNNAAFGKLPAGALDDLLLDPEGDLKDILLYHVLAEDLRAADITDGLTKTTALGKDVAFTVHGDVMVDGATIIVTDILASNGVIHIIDTVMLPPASQ